MHSLDKGGGNLMHAYVECDRLPQTGEKFYKSHACPCPSSNSPIINFHSLPQILAKFSAQMLSSTLATTVACSWCQLLRMLEGTLTAHAFIAWLQSTVQVTPRHLSLLNQPSCFDQMALAENLDLPFCYPSAQGSPVWVCARVFAQSRRSANYCQLLRCLSREHL